METSVPNSNTHDMASSSSNLTSITKPQESKPETSSSYSTVGGGIGSSATAAASIPADPVESGSGSGSGSGSTEEMPSEGELMCRVCRSPASPTSPLFHPCKCSGSMKFIHQDW
jgi:hypothetical protein